jgi:hypothetical protein
MDMCDLNWIEHDVRSDAMDWICSIHVVARRVWPNDR